MNDVVYSVHKTPRWRMMVVQLDRLAPYEGFARDERHQREDVASREQTTWRKETPKQITTLKHRPRKEENVIQRWAIRDEQP
jgi:hypothetical protein